VLVLLWVDLLPSCRSCPWLLLLLLLLMIIPNYSCLYSFSARMQVLLVVVGGHA
jgi:hypothetical protein